MLGLVNSFWNSLWSYILYVFTLFSRFSAVKTVKILSESDEKCVESEEFGEEIKGFDRIEEKEMNFNDENVVNSSTSKYQFYGGNSVCCTIIEEPQTLNFTVHELCVFSHDGFVSKHDSVQKVGSFVEGEIRGFSEPLLVENIVCDGQSGVDDEVVSRDETESSDHVFKCNDILSGQDEVVEQDEAVCSDHLLLVQNDCVDGENEVVVELRIVESPTVCDVNCDEKDASSVSQDGLSEIEETVSLDEVAEKVEVCDQVHSLIAKSDDFWSTIYKIDCVFGNHDEIMVDYEEECLKSLDDSSMGQSNGSLDDVSVGSDHRELDSEFIELERNTEYNSTEYNPTVHTEENIVADKSSDSEEDEDERDQECSTAGDLRGIDSTESCDDGDVETGNDDVLLEQKELIRQMKKEMRQLKVKGLPTILEEFVSPRVEDDLRPLRIDEKVGHKDRMDEIETFYKRYLDKMRKLDILSQQTMYAIGLLQLKNQDQLALNRKGHIPVMKSLLAHNFWFHKPRKHEADHVKELIKDMRRQLELVYVGQICLSWEILKWQYRKVEELRAHDPYGFHQYNHVAGGFQKFQVLLQRFTEDEPFQQGPRLQHYLKSRCANSNILQVPLLKDDPRSECKGEKEGGISVSILKEVIASSIRSFWDFVHADKDDAHTITLMGIYGGHVHLEDPSCTDLLTDVRSNLHKKEKMIKDLVRSGNCLVRKFQKHHDQRLSLEMLLAQVELRLVSRVLHMSKITTDQLVWCHKKINKMTIVGRKVHVESSFLLFPC
ncbi:hypothetical protein vseg_019928 [Gypsophila vaccaria]